MTRTFRNFDGKMDFGPADPALAKPYTAHDECDSPKECREKSPFKPGDVFYIRENGRVMLCRVYCLFSHYLQRHVYWLPRFRVQFATKDGTWSRQWRDVWPGDHYRAYFTDKGAELDPAAEYAAERAPKRKVAA